MDPYDYSVDTLTPNRLLETVIYIDTEPIIDGWFKVILTGVFLYTHQVKQINEDSAR